MAIVNPHIDWCQSTFSPQIGCQQGRLPVFDKDPSAPWLRLTLNRVSDDQVVFLVETTTCMDGPSSRSEIDVRQVEAG